jgi:predicted HicB family RNase H-like nuclease
MTMRAYKGYAGSIEYSTDDKCFHGRVQGLRDVINYEADTVEELEKAFHDSVDDYLAFCADTGREPENTKSGKIAVRMSPEIHEMVADAASADAKSVNQWISDTLREAAEKRLAEGSIKIRIR